jgi:hypothetical protein
MYAQAFILNELIYHITILHYTQPTKSKKRRKFADQPNNSKLNCNVKTTARESGALYFG